MASSSRRFAGGDLGTCNICFATSRNANPSTLRTMPMMSGHLTLPARVRLDRRGKLLVGQEAATGSGCVQHAKRVLGLNDNRATDTDMLRAQLKKLKSKGVEYKLEKSGEVKLHVGQGTYLSPEEVIALLALYAKEAMASQVDNTDDVPFAVTTPAYFNDRQREATERLAKLAGMTVRRVVNEPTAALYDFVAGNDSLESGLYMVFDIGGGTTDISVGKVVRKEGGNIQVTVKYKTGDNFLGGEDFTLAAADLLKKVVGGNLQKTDEEAIAAAAEHVKVAVSKSQKLDEYSIKLSEGEKKIKLKYSQLQEAYSDLYSRLSDLLVTFVNKDLVENFELEELQDMRVVLVGGASYDPGLKKLLKDKLSELLTCTFQNVDHFNNADETVARGAALQSALADDASKYLTMIDATSQSLGVSAHHRHEDVCKEFYSIVIPKGSPLPAEHVEHYQSARGDKTTVSVFEGDDMTGPWANSPLGEFDILHPDVTDGSLHLELTMTMNLQNRLEIQVISDRGPTKWERKLDHHISDKQLVDMQQRVDLIWGKRKAFEKIEAAIESLGDKFGEERVQTLMDADFWDPLTKAATPEQLTEAQDNFDIEILPFLESELEEDKPDIPATQIPDNGVEPPNKKAKTDDI